MAEPIECLHDARVKAAMVPLIEHLMDYTFALNMITARCALYVAYLLV